MKYNKSKTYLLPLLGQMLAINPRYFKHLKQTYVFDDKGMHENCIFIEHDFNAKDRNLTMYESVLLKNDYFVKVYDLTPKTTVYVFKFPVEYIKEYNLYQEGKYSEFGIDAKKQILNFYQEIYEGNQGVAKFLLKIKGVLFKQKRLRETIEKELGVKLSNDCELGESFDRDAETIILTRDTISI